MTRRKLLVSRKDSVTNFMIRGYQIKQYDGPTAPPPLKFFPVSWMLMHWPADLTTNY